MRNPVQARSAQSAELMMDAALRLAASEGLRGVTVAAVARESGTSNGALYHRFKDRLGLLLATQDRFLTEFEQRFEDAALAADQESDRERAVTLIVGGYLDLASGMRRTFRAFNVEGHDENALRVRGSTTSHRIAARTCDLLQRRFDCPRPAAEAAYRLLLGMTASKALWQDAQISDYPLDLDTLKQHLCSAIIAIVA